jgi:membrane protease YdiL (CAAX protease family)
MDARRIDESSRAGLMERLRTLFLAVQEYPATRADLRALDVLGLRLPVRATVVITVVTFVLLLDYSRTFIADETVSSGRTPDAMWVTALERAVLFGILPLAVVLLGFRDRPSRYGLTAGDWRAGLVLMAAGCIVMTPIVLWFATLPDVRAFYGPSAASVGQVLVTNAVDLAAAEFLFRGFLMLTLVRVIGPLGVLVATMPFVFAHLGKPELELFSTLGGGLVYGWLAWRTRSIVWGAIGHTYILTLVTIAAA